MEAPVCAESCRQKQFQYQPDPANISQSPLKNTSETGNLV
jgi:hypothetical protein